MDVLNNQREAAPKQAMDKLETGSSPPPYEAAAYPKAQSTRRLYKIFSFRAVVAFVVLTFLLCLNTYLGLSSRPALSALDEKRFQAGLARCAAITKLPTRLDPRDRKQNPRWNAASGQNRTVVLRNVTLFDGADFGDDAVDIVFSHGLITSVTPSQRAASAPAGAEEVQLHGAYVTPGLIDMHSHHLVEDWPAISDIPDGNEMLGGLGPLTPYVRVLDSMKAYDVATKLVASGGVTSSLIIPGSANIMGGEGAVVKNAWRSGPNGEFVVEEMLLEHDLPPAERRRYMKMACGENPIGVYKHTRMGNAWVLRKWLARARELVDKQDGWCEAAGVAASAEGRAGLLAEKGGYPEELELDSTAGMLRGQVAMHNHCYEPEDFETMLRISHEFGFRVRAFHHAISAWQVPQMLKEYGENLTIATFAEFALYKKEAYAASLSAGKILNDHDIPVAYKSDHSMEDLNSKYLLLQSAVGHSFGLPADKALQAVTSVPAASLEIDGRVGYVRAGYDADIVVWDSHPLSAGATPKQVFIDGVATLDPAQVEASLAHVAVAHDGADAHRGAGKPAMRATIAHDERERLCSGSRDQGRGFVISGITRSFLDEFPEFLTAVGVQPAREGNLTMVIANGKVACLGAGADCRAAATKLRGGHDEDGHVTSIELENGHLSRGLVTVTSALGIAEIAMAPTTGDGVVKAASEGSGVDHAKYGVSLGGGKTRSKTFARARLGGVTRAVQAPMSEGGLVVGVSTGMRTGVDSTLLNGGLFQEDVALHVALGEDAKVNGGAVSVAIEKLRGLIRAGGKKGLKEKEEGDVDEEDPWALVANGSLPLVVKADSTHDIQQVILLKKDYPNVNTVILGGHEAPLFAEEIAKAEIPLIFTGARPGPDSWTKKDSPPGPPLGRSPADILSEAGVFYAVAINTDGGPPGDSRIQSLALEASWTAKYAGLSDHEALRLVSSNVEEILGLERSGDVVVWEGNPLQFGTPVLAFQARRGGRLEVGSCWPNEADG